MTSQEFLEALSAKEYLQHFHLDHYLSEALRSCDSPEQLAQFFQEVLDGSRLKAKAQQFRTVIATPENRRAFVELMRTQLSLVAPKPNEVAMTVLDFHDMLVLLLDDFPLDLIIEAADFAPRVVDAAWHHLIGQPAPDRGGIASALANGEVLFCMHDLQRMVEFRLVYGEVLEAVGRYYQGRVESSSRYELVKSLRSELSAGIRAFGPSEGAWQRLLCGPTGSILTCKLETLTYIEAVHEMAECFELVPLPIPPALLAKALGPKGCEGPKSRDLMVTYPMNMGNGGQLWLEALEISALFFPFIFGYL
eukprot:s4101_g2.t1